MKTIQISFNYDPEILEKAGVDLDSGTLAFLKGIMLTDLAEHIEYLREEFRHDAGRPCCDTHKSQLALAEAFTSEG
jgi:hypothetical protein